MLVFTIFLSHLSLQESTLLQQYQLYKENTGQNQSTILSLSAYVGLHLYRDTQRGQDRTTQIMGNVLHFIIPGTIRIQHILSICADLWHKNLLTCNFMVIQILNVNIKTEAPLFKIPHLIDTKS